MKLQGLITAILCSVILLETCVALTPAEQGTVITISGVQCRFCLLDCAETPLLKNCKQRYFQYGCHIHQYCLSTNTATAREFFAGIAICVYRNGCELVKTDEKSLLEATPEGQLDLQMKAFVAQKAPTQSSIFRLQSEVYSMYQNLITNIEANWISNSNKLTEGKRQAFQLINISPAFFLLQELLQSMFNEESAWREFCDGLTVPPEPVHSIAAFFEAVPNFDKKTDTLLATCSKIQQQMRTLNDTQFILASTDRPQCRERVMYLYVYRNLCKLPKSFLLTAKIADQIVNSEYKLSTEMLYMDFTLPRFYYTPAVEKDKLILKAVNSPRPLIQTIYDGIHNYAFEYVDVMENEKSETKKQARLAAAKAELQSVAALCSDLYCTYTCKDYAYDVATRYCDIYDDAVDLVRQTLISYCTVTYDGRSEYFQDTAVILPVQFYESKLAELKYCKAAQRNIGRANQEVCAFAALKATAVKYYSKYVIEGPYVAVRMAARTESTEPYTEELDFLLAKFADCSKTKCSRQGGCDIQQNDLKAVRGYFDKKITWLENALNDNSNWKQILSPPPQLKMTFVVGTDSGIWYRSMSPANSVWNNWVSMGERVQSPPTAVAIGNGGAMVFVRSTDYTIKYKQFGNNQWSNWLPLGGYVTARPTAVSPRNGYVLLFAVGSNNQLYYRMYNSASWTDWVSLGGYCTASPSATSWGNGKVIVFIKERNNSVAYRVWDADTNSFGPWINLKGVIIGETSNVALGDGRLASFVWGSDRALWYNMNQNQAWFSSSWVSLGGVLTTSPSAAVWGEKQDKIFVFVRGTDNALYYRLYENAAWQNWVSLGGVLWSTPSAVTWDANRVAVFVRGTDQALWFRVFSNNTWGPWTSLQGVITTDAHAISLK